MGFRGMSGGGGELCKMRGQSAVHQPHRNSPPQKTYHRSVNSMHFLPPPPLYDIARHCPWRFSALKFGVPDRAIKVVIAIAGMLAIKVSVISCDPGSVVHQALKFGDKEATTELTKPNLSEDAIYGTSLALFHSSLLLKQALQSPKLAGEHQNRH